MTTYLITYLITTLISIIIVVSILLLTNSLAKSAYYATDNGVLLTVCCFCVIPFINVGIIIISIGLLIACLVDRSEGRTFFSKRSFYKEK